MTPHGTSPHRRVQVAFADRRPPRASIESGLTPRATSAFASLQPCTLESLEMDESAVRASVEAVGEALVAGDVDAAIGYLSEELQRNPGEVIAMLPLPATEASIVSVERATSAVVVVLRLVGETSDVELQTRWTGSRASSRSAT
jgi:hypothetical protein